jgi:hypothetical protein
MKSSCGQDTLHQFVSTNVTSCCVLKFPIKLCAWKPCTTFCEIASVRPATTRICSSKWFWEQLSSPIITSKMKNIRQFKF